jgi:arylsulfatase A-like enzyme
MNSKVTFILIVLLCSFSIFGQNKQPNIIFILADDHSYLSAGFNRNDIIKTPNLDKLAKNGIVFDNYYNTTAICLASRVQIMTGMLEYKTG